MRIVKYKDEQGKRAYVVYQKDNTKVEIVIGDISIGLFTGKPLLFLENTKTCLNISEVERILNKMKELDNEN